MFHPFPFLNLPNPDEAAFLSLRPEEKKLRGAEIAWSSLSQRAHIPETEQGLVRLNSGSVLLLICPEEEIIKSPFLNRRKHSPSSNGFTQSVYNMI